MSPTSCEVTRRVSWQWYPCAHWSCSVLQGETNPTGCWPIRGNDLYGVGGGREFPDSDIPVLIEAAQYCKEKQIQHAVYLLEVIIYTRAGGGEVTRRVSWQWYPCAHYTPGIYAEEYIFFVFHSSVCSFVIPSHSWNYFKVLRLSFSGGVYLANYSSESIPIWTIGTLEGRLSFQDYWPQGPCPGVGLEVKI